MKTPHPAPIVAPAVIRASIGAVPNEGVGLGVLFCGYAFNSPNLKAGKALNK
jgi:hypothetical protein